MSDRIKLAEAMGWTRSTIGTEYCWRHTGGRVIGMCPDPFTDANDDYAVLEWMRLPENGPIVSNFESDIEQPGWAFRYQIGDYANAALKVLD